MKFWDVVIITASSERQAALYRDEIERRRMMGMLAEGTEFLVVPDPGDRRVGSGGATINALGVLGRDVDWWSRHRALLIHSGGDSRRLPQYSPMGKLFGVLPSRIQPKRTTTVFDETMMLSAAWCGGVSSGLLVASGDVVLRFDANHVNWNRPGATGIAMKLPAETANHHGVYVVGANDQVYTFLQKPSFQEIKAAGGFLDDGRVAVDIGLLRFDAQLTGDLTTLAHYKEPRAVDLYDQITRGLTGQWKPEMDASDFWLQLAKVLSSPERPAAFHCAIVEGEFIHAGTTRSFRSLASGSGGILDSAIGEGSKVGHESVILECDITGQVVASRGSILHGLTGLSGAIEVPENIVVHQLPVEIEERRGWVIRTYGVEDDSKQPLAKATWLNRPILETLARLGINTEEVWTQGEEPTLWNAALFPVTTPDEAWQCARWMMGYAGRFDVAEWRVARRLSLAESAGCADGQVLAETQNHRLKSIWHDTTLELAESGADLQPLLANLPGLAPALRAGHSLRARANRMQSGSHEDLTRAASFMMQASRLLARAGLEGEAADSEKAAFTCIQEAVRTGVTESKNSAPASWVHPQVHVSAPSRIDFGGGWSDTPPFCFDWGGTVLNCALEVDGRYPIETEIRRIEEPVIRCFAGSEARGKEYRVREELLGDCEPGSVYSIPRAALQLLGLPLKHGSLEETLLSMGGGLEIRCRVRLPIGSGLGTSSILAATVIRALAVMSGSRLEDYELTEAVMKLEQMMTTGGGWQDQAGGIFPGAKLLITGPGSRQRIRVQPLGWSRERQTEFGQHLVLFNTGIQRMAKDLLRQVVSRYLARETATIQVLHSIKTLAMEMSYAMVEGDWEHLGGLLDRHWQLNQVLDPHTANAPINALLNRARPYIYGAKLAGAGGGGFLILLARDPDASVALQKALMQNAPTSSGVVNYRVAEEGMRVKTGEVSSEDQNAETVNREVMDHAGKMQELV